MGVLQQALAEPRDKTSLAYLKRLTLSLIRVALADPVFNDFKTVRVHMRTILYASNDLILAGSLQCVPLE